MCIIYCILWFYSISLFCFRFFIIHPVLQLCLAFPNMFFCRSYVWETSTTQMSATPSTYLSRNAGSSLCGIPQAPGSSATASVRVRSQHCSQVLADKMREELLQVWKVLWTCDTAKSTCFNVCYVGPIVITDTNLTHIIGKLPKIVKEI